MKAFLGKVGGRKFIVTILGLAAMMVNGLTGVNIDDATVQMIAGIVASFVIGQGVADGLSGGATSTSSEE